MTTASYRTHVTLGHTFDGQYEAMQHVASLLRDRSATGLAFAMLDELIDAGFASVARDGRVTLLAVDMTSWDALRAAATATVEG